MKRAWVLAALACAAPAFAQERLPIGGGDVVWITGGAFTIGASDDDLAYAMALCAEELEVPIADDEPGGCRTERFLVEVRQHRATIPTFGIDRTEVTNAAYRRCVLDGHCVPSAARESSELTDADHPVVGVRWTDARAYCEHVHGRLPTEAEWEKAARGDDETRRFPWGRNYDARLANHGRAPLRTDSIDGFLSSAPVGSFPDGASPYGVLDLAGNVAEWTADAPTVPAQLDFVDLSAYRVLRGGSYTQALTAMRVTARTWATMDSATSDVGFRCAYDP